MEGKLQPPSVGFGLEQLLIGVKVQIELDCVGLLAKLSDELLLLENHSFWVDECAYERPICRNSVEDTCLGILSC